MPTTSAGVRFSPDLHQLLFSEFLVALVQCSIQVLCLLRKDQSSTLLCVFWKIFSSVTLFSADTFYNSFRLFSLQTGFCFLSSSLSTDFINMPWVLMLSQNIISNIISLNDIEKCKNLTRRLCYKGVAYIKMQVRTLWCQLFARLRSKVSVILCHSRTDAY